MKRILLLISLISIIASLTETKAQKTITTSGGNASGSGGSVSYSVGQTFHSIHTGETGSVAEGVQQPYEISVITGIQDATGIDLIISAFPNPATDYLILRFGNYDYQNVSYQILDVNGRLIKAGHIESSETRINMAGLPSGVYLIRVYSEEFRDHSDISSPRFDIKTFRIIKN